MTTTSELIAAYYKDRMHTYGPCVLCGSPRTQCWDVEHKDGQTNIGMGLRCLGCGDGDPTYQYEETA